MNDDELRRWGHQPGSAAGGLILLVMVFFLVMALVYSLLAALFAAPLLMTVVRLSSSDPVPQFGKAFTVTCVATFLFLAVTVAMLYFLPDRITQAVMHQLDLLVPRMMRGSPQRFVPYMLPPASVWRTAAMLCVPGLAAYALALMSLGGSFSGALGFVRGLFVAVPILAISSGVTTGLCVVAVDRVQSRHIGLASFFSAASYVGVLVFLFTIAASFVAGWVLTLVTRCLSRRQGLSYAQAYGVAFKGLLAYLACTALVIFLLPDSNPLTGYAHLLATTGDPALLVQALRFGVAEPALNAFLLAQLPGMAALGGILTGRIVGRVAASSAT